MYINGNPIGEIGIENCSISDELIYSMICQKCRKTISVLVREIMSYKYCPYCGYDINSGGEKNGFQDRRCDKV